MTYLGFDFKLFLPNSAPPGHQHATLRANAFLSGAFIPDEAAKQKSEAFHYDGTNDGKQKVTGTKRAHQAANCASERPNSLLDQSDFPPSLFCLGALCTCNVPP
jgi:hypothetical protein